MDDQTKMQTFRKVETQVVDAVVSDGKDWYKSKTLWAGLIMAIVPAAFPPATAVIAANPALASAAAGAIVVALRHLTDSSIRWPWS